MGQIRQKQFRLWAITLFISGLFSFIQLTLANFPGNLLSSHASISPSFSAFVYPNPAQGTVLPTLVVEPGSAEKITARIYDPSGSMVFQARVDDSTLSSISSSVAYELPLKTNFAPGVYVGVILGYEGNSISHRSIVHFSVVK